MPGSIAENRRRTSGVRPRPQASSWPRHSVVNSEVPRGRNWRKAEVRRLMPGALLYGSTRQSVRKCILCGFLESDEFGLGGCQALRFQQQVIEVAVTPTTAQQRFDVSIDGFHYPQPYFNFAVVKNSFQMFE